MELFFVTDWWLVVSLIAFYASYDTIMIWARSFKGASQVFGFLLVSCAMAYGLLLFGIAGRLIYDFGWSTPLTLLAVWSIGGMISGLILTGGLFSRLLAFGVAPILAYRLFWYVWRGFV